MPSLLRLLSIARACFAWPSRVGRILACAACALACLAAPARAQDAQGVCRVDADVSASAPDGATWASAFADLQAALGTAGCTEVWIAEGTYVPASSGNRGASFTVTGAQDGLGIYGGFEGNEAARTDRAPRQHRVTLSGDIDGDGTLAGNSYHVLFFNGSTGAPPITTATVLDGVTVTGGNAQGSGDDREGGALFCDGRDAGQRCSPRITGVTFAGNQAAGNGGAVYNTGFNGGTSSPRFTNVSFTGNTASDDGGALYNDGSGGPSVSSPTLANVVFAGNRAERDGGAIFNNASSNGTSSPRITNASFTGNAAATHGGAVYNFAAFGDGSTTARFENVILWDNTADADADGNGEGDEIYNFDAPTTLDHTLVEGGLGSADINNEGPDASVTDGGGNLSGDPLFADPSQPNGADGVPGTLDDGLRVTMGSPVIDAGATSLLPADAADLDGDGDTSEPLSLDRALAVRQQNATGSAGFPVDVGAYEADGTPLPVELARLTATAAGRSIVVTWATASETANAGFAVEMKPEGRDAAPWRTVGYVEGAGTTTEAQTYRYRIARASVGTHTVRLRQVDFDGTATPSDGVTVEVGLAARYALEAYPSPVPAGRDATVAVAVQAAQAVTVAVYDVLGRRVTTLHDGSIPAQETLRLRLPTRGLASGVYLVRASGEQFAATRRVTVVR
jgi:predicted outer membrane repeat protein